MPLNLQGLRTAIYKVDDIKLAKEWYIEALGFQPYFDEPYYVGFNVAGYELGLQPIDASDEAKTANVIAYWGVDDVAVAYDGLLKHGASPFEEPTDVGGGIVVATVLDPWGNTFGLICNPHFKLP